MDTWGLPPLARMTSLFLEMNAYDIQTRIVDEGKAPLAPLVHVHELTRGGAVMQDGNVAVTCALVDHPPVTPAFAFRFDAHDRSIVISGDTRRSEALIRLARGADVLVHEAFYAPAVERLAARVPDTGKCWCPHFVPPDDGAVSDQMWIDAARSTYKGRIIIGKDLLEI